MKNAGRKPGSAVYPAKNIVNLASLSARIYREATLTPTRRTEATNEEFGLEGDRAYKRST